jgi:hypothetical protein
MAFKKETLSSWEIVALLESLETFRCCVAVMHLDAGLKLETLLALKKELSLISLVDTRRQAVSITGQKFILSVKMLTRNELSGCCHLE